MLELVITEGMLFVVVILLLCVDYGVAHIALTLCVCPCNVTGSCASKLARSFLGCSPGHMCVCACVHMCVCVCVCE